MINLSKLVRRGSRLFAFCGCGYKEDFDAGKVRMLESASTHLDGEEVTLTSIQRGVHEDLWERPTQFSSERSTARLTEKGRDLKFNDDRVIEPDCRLTCRLEARSRFRWTRCRISGTARKTALVDTKAGVKIQHSCFRNPLPIGESKRATSRRTHPFPF
jgi:hypothetical protein